jgi:tetratricopeptide (TPR) repeat protein
MAMKAVKMFFHFRGTIFMNKYDEYAEQIDSYLDDVMVPEQRREFEAQIAADPDLAAEVEVFRKERTIGRLLRREHYRQKMQGWSKDSVFARVKARRQKRYTWQITGVIALVAMAAIGIRLVPSCNSESNSQQDPAPPRVLQLPINDPIAGVNGGKSSSNTIPAPVDQRESPLLLQATKVLDRYPNMGTPDAHSETGGTLGAQTDILMDRAKKAMVADRYQEADTLLRKILNQFPEDLWSRERLAWVYYKLGEYDKAIAQYKAYAEGEVNTKKTDWFSLQYYLLDYSKYKKEADSLIGLIIDNPQHLYYKQTKSLQKMMQ